LDSRSSYPLLLGGSPSVKPGQFRQVFISLSGKLSLAFRKYCELALAFLGLTMEHTTLAMPFAQPSPQIALFLAQSVDFFRDSPQASCAAVVLRGPLVGDLLCSV
jgi:hypothetical protein